MRGDEDIGHYLPLLRRIIILVAVITAIPVVLWTITAFVRAYVDPPKMPTFHQLASKASINEPASTGTNQETTDRMMAAAAQQAKLADPSTATDTHGDAAAPKGPLLAERTSEAPMNAPPPNPPAPPPTAPIATVAPAVAPAAVALPAPASSPGPVAAAKPADPWPPMPGSAKTAELPMPPAAAMPATADTNAPNRQVANAQPDIASQPAADEMPAAAPLAGPIPLPKRRPRVLAEAQAELTPPTSEPATRTEAPTRMASAGPIPMPRPRPDGAPASTTPADSSSGGPLDFITNIFGGNK
ncbi:MAG TPA: hypothetical protein VMV19_14965 [Xanthobacteraceae bacterium]|nr:hypothetical protein [Xanthobacteraceae bacterium]